MLHLIVFFKIRFIWEMVSLRFSTSPVGRQGLAEVARGEQWSLSISQQEVFCCLKKWTCFVSEP